MDTTEQTDRAGAWWHLAVVGVSALTLGVLAITGATAAVPLAGAALAVFIAAWFAFGRRTFDGDPGWIWFTTLIVAVCLVGALADPGFAVWQALAFPLVWTVAPGPRAALVSNVAVAAAIATGYAISGQAPLEAIAVEILSLGLSLAMGFWITRIAGLSERRRDLVMQLTAAQHEVAALSREAGGASERERLARELHDTIAQSLTGIVMLAERAQSRHPDDASLTVLEETAREALAETRGLVAATAAVPLEGGLAAAVLGLAARFERETGVRVDASVQAEVPRGLEVVLLRCAQEGLANVRKHAGASAVSVRIGTLDGVVQLTVADDGAGLPTDPERRGFGLAGMRDRVALVGGRLSVGPLAPHGTELVVQVPVEHRAVTA